jgi:hypothetical protein
MFTYLVSLILVVLIVVLILEDPSVVGMAEEKVE